MKETDCNATRNEQQLTKQPMPIFGYLQGVCCNSTRKGVKQSNLSLFYYQIVQIYRRANRLSMRKGLVDLSATCATARIKIRSGGQ